MTSSNNPPPSKPWYFNLNAPMFPGAGHLLDDDFDDEEIITSVEELELELDDFAVPVEKEVPKHPLAKKVKMPDGTEGMECIECHKCIQYAEPNRDDGAFKCHSCRTGW